MMSFFQQPREYCGAYSLLRLAVLRLATSNLCSLEIVQKITPHRMFFNVTVRLDSLFSCPN